MKDILGKLTDIEASAPKPKSILTEDAIAPMIEESKPASFKEVFESIAGMKPIPVVGKEGGTQQTGAGFVNITDPSLQGLGKTLGDLAAQKKLQIVVPTQAQPAGAKPVGTTGTTQGGQGQAMGAGQTMQEDDLDERDEGKPGKNFAKIAKSAAKRYGSKEAGERVAGAVRAKLAKQGKLEEEQLDELSPETVKAARDKRLRQLSSQAGATGPKTLSAITNPQFAKPSVATVNKYWDQEKARQGQNNPQVLNPNEQPGYNKGKASPDELANWDKAHPQGSGQQAWDARTDRGIERNRQRDLSRGKMINVANKKLAGTANVPAKAPASKNQYQEPTSWDDPVMEGAKVDRMVKHIEKSERKLGKSKEKASDIAWATANKRGMLDNKNKKVEEGSRSLASASKKHAAAGEVAINKAERAVRKGLSIESAAREFDLTPSEINKLKERISTQKVKEADIPSTQGIDTKGAGLGAGRSPTTLEGKTMNKKAKPDFLDMDKDGNKKEPMKKAVADKKKKPVKEGMSHRIAAARHEGRAHGLKGAAHCGKNYDDLEEAKAYHMGYKDGLDECYGMGVYETAPAMPAATVHGMADGAMEEGNAFTAALARTPKGGKFSVGGKTFTDRSSYEAKIDEYAFESWSKQLKNLINEGKVNEGLSVSVSKGNHAEEDSVNINATGGEADDLLALVKHAGLGLFADEKEPSSAMSLQPAHNEPEEIGSHGGDIEVVDGSDDMLSLMKKLGGVEASGSEDYADEEGCGCEDETNEAMCNECGMYESDCGCSHGKEKVEEVESEDQMEFEVAEANAPDNGSANSSNDEKGNAAANASLAKADDADEEDEEEVSESFFSLLGKLSKLAESKESESEEDDKAEKAGKKVTKDIEYDDKKDKKEKVDEWANQVGKGPGKGTDASFEQDIEFMTKVIAGGLNKPKSTGQTTIPVIAGQEDRMHDSPKDWATLAGIKKA